MSRWLCLLTVLLALLSSREAKAINQPGGTVIPVGSALQNLFTARSEAINALTDAAVMPERFVPGCRLTFTLTSRADASYQNAFGWYNVTGSTPTESDLHVLIPCTAPSGFVAELDLTREPAYRGGEIGFFLRTPQRSTSDQACGSAGCCASVGSPMGFTYYSERRFSPDSAAAGGTGFIHLLTYDSRATPNTFYFAWEDLYGGGDNNFTDFVAQVSNIVCSGAGARCSTGERGVCADGTQQCRSGALACVRNTAPSAERCDGLDNDCNGTTDDGEGLCAAGNVCDRGTCVPRCVEMSCFEGQQCTARGTCVEIACATVPCADGQRCVEGRCVEACENVRCPSPTVCRAGRCVDACAGVMCDTDQVCDEGVCVPKCQCRRCAASETCGGDGRCVETACSMVTCPAGQSCAAGTCRDSCDGAMCPRGEACSMGRCAPVVVADAGVDAAVVDASRPDAASFDASTDAMTDARVDTVGSEPFVVQPRGCSCATVPVDNVRGVSWLSLFAVLALVRRSRRMRSARGLQRDGDARV